MNSLQRFVPTTLVLLLLCSQAYAAGGLMVDPLRIVFDGNQRTAQITLMNTGQKRLTYRLSLVQREMSENGQLLEVSDAGSDRNSAASLIRFAPRLITLEAGGEQVVKLLLRKPAELQPGEYRSHLLLQPVPETSAPPEDPRADTEQEKSLGIGLSVVYGISLPVIVRHGETSAATWITDVAAPVGSPSGTLRFAIRREGSASTYGDCTVFVREEGKPERRVGKAGGVAVYPPLALRWAAVAVDALPARGELRVEYRTSPLDGGKLLAETTVQLP